VRPAAQVGEGALRVHRDGLAFGQLRDELLLVRLAFERVARLKAVEHGALERLFFGDDLAHALLDGRKVLRRERPIDVEVVVEAVLDRRTDAEPHRREQVFHRFGHHVRGRVPQDAQRLGVALRDDGHLVAVVPLSVHVHEPAVHPPRERRLREPRPDGARDVCDRRPLVDVDAAAVREPDAHPSHVTTSSAIEPAPGGAHCLVLQYGQTVQSSFKGRPQPMHSFLSFFMHEGQMR